MLVLDELRRVEGIIPYGRLLVPELLLNELLESQEPQLRGHAQAGHWGRHSSPVVLPFCTSRPMGLQRRNFARIILHL